MSFVTKMRLKPEEPVYVLHAPGYLLAAFAGLDVKRKLASKKIKQVVLFVEDSVQLNATAPAVCATLQEDGMLWVAYPKKSGSIPSDLNRDAGWEVVFSTGWEGVASISIDNDWSALRFKHSSTVKGGLAPIAERKTEGIDYINRKVTLPKDVSASLKEFPGLEAFFYTMSFTCQKEYVEHIVEAKKPETRLRRTDRVIEMMIKMQEEKELKAKKKNK